MDPLDNNGGPTPTHALRAGSPAIDTGNPDPPVGGLACNDFDQRYVPRPEEGPLDRTGIGFASVARCDIGAYEYAAPEVSVANSSVNEGNTGTRSMFFRIRIPFFPPEPLTVHYVTSPGTAKAGSDYQHTDGSVTFMPGELTKLVRVKVFGDRIREGNETFLLDIRNNAADPNDNKVRIGRRRAVGTILNDD